MALFLLYFKPACLQDFCQLFIASLSHFEVKTRSLETVHWLFACNVWLTLSERNSWTSNSNIFPPIPLIECHIASFYILEDIISK